VQSGKAAARRSNAHGAAINRLLPLSETAVASGDDDGALHLWDTRQARRAVCAHQRAPILTAACHRPFQGLASPCSAASGTRRRCACGCCHVSRLRRRLTASAGVAAR